LQVWWSPFATVTSRTRSTIPTFHLAIAESISRGLYGINAQEYSSPSSSIIFPFLLSPFVFLGVEKLAPLALGLISNAASTWMIAGFFHRHVIAGGSGDHDRAWLLLVPLLLVSVNAIALPFVGMEHPLHLLAVVLTITGLARLGETARMNGALAIGLMMGPLIRFEGLALSGAVLLILLAKDHARTALLLGTAEPRYRQLRTVHARSRPAPDPIVGTG
jgi:hypothetical protein